MRPRTYDCGYGCPIEAAFDAIGGRWKGVLLFHLLDGPKRNGELRRRVRGATPRVLAQQLRELEAAGVVARTIYPEVPPRVEYALTPFGRSLEPVLLSLRDWGESYLDRIEAAIAAAGSPRLAEAG
jgi:DNA-binding HxlR family transcriptional regulator